MRHEIIKNPMGMVQFHLDKGESVTGEAGAMVYMKGNVETQTTVRRGGLFKAVKASVLGGETFFVNRFVAREDCCLLGLTGNRLGDLGVIPVTEELIVQSGAFVASTGSLELDTKWQGFSKGIFGTNLFMLKTSGSGNLFVNGLGGIVRIDLKGGERMILDNYQLVAMDAHLKYRITRHGNFKTTIFGGEALVLDISGTGTIHIQTKNMMELARALAPFMPKSRWT